MDENSIHLPAGLDQHGQVRAHLHTLDLMSAQATESAVLAPFWALGDIVNFSGPAGCGKSTLAADIAIAWAHPERHGQALGGLLQFNPVDLVSGRIAILDNENCEARWCSLLRRMMEAQGLDPLAINNTIYYLRPSDIGLHDPNRWESLGRVLAEVLVDQQVRFFIGDTLARIWGADDIISPAWVQRGLAPFREACQQNNLTGLMLTHVARDRKDGNSAEGPIGTSFQENVVDGQLVFARTTSGGRHGLAVTHRKSRRSTWIQQGSKVTVWFGPHYTYEPQDGWQNVWPHEPPDYEAEDLEQDPTTRTRISDLLKSDPTRSWSTTEIAKEVSRQERTARHHLEALERAGYVKRGGHGPKTRWEAVP